MLAVALAKAKEVKEIPNVELSAHHNHLALALADFSCTLCCGRGHVKLKAHTKDHTYEVLCKCVAKKAFRSCLWFSTKRDQNVYQCGTWWYPIRCYSADFWSLLRTTLTPIEFKVVLLDHNEVNWITGCKSTGLKKGDWFHCLYRSQTRAGKALIDAKFYPIREYFRK
jgi:hypothetical protein